MSNALALNRRIKSAKNIRQITKAMEMVSASKMRRAQNQALRSRPYSRKLESTLHAISKLTSSASHPLLSSHESGVDIIVLVNTDRALAGSLNSNLYRATHSYLKQLDTKPQIILVGQKAKSYVLSEGLEVYADFSNLPDPVSYQDTTAISQLILTRFLELEFKSVTLVYMDFVSTLVQKFRHLQLLPIPTEILAEESPEETIQALPDIHASYLFEPSAQQMLEWLLPYYVTQTVYQVILEAKASEHSARMVAMKNASENASEIIYDLTLSYNKQRQASITAELLDNARSANAV